MSEMATALPGAAFPDAEELLDGLAVEMAGVHTAEQVENFWKSVKRHKLAMYPASLLLLHIRERSGII